MSTSTASAVAPPGAPSAAPRRGALPIVVGLLFFASGMSGLVYEVIWSRYLQQVFGVSTFAITTVVAAYMAGLALGSGLLGRLADRLSPRGAVAAYGVLEIVIGLFAFAFAPLLRLVADVYVQLAGSAAADAAVRVFADFALSFGLLLVPTTLMGGTLPLVSRFFAAASGRTGKGFGWAYALNTIGAVTGVFLAGFVLLHTFGLRASLYGFGVFNLALGSIAFLAGGGLASLRSRPATVEGSKPATAETDTDAKATPTAEDESEGTNPSSKRSLLVLAALTGCVALAAEIVWIRGFANLFLSTTYTFSLVLMVFLVGIAAGSAIGSRATPSRRLLRVVLVLLGVSTLTQLLLYGTAHRVVMQVVFAETSYEGFLLVQAAIIAVIVFPLTLCSGIALPTIVGLTSRGVGRAGRDVGRVYIANTIGSVLGAVLAGFVLLPLLGASTGARALALLTLAGVLLLGVSRGALLTVAAGATLAIVAPGPSQARATASPVLVAKRTPRDIPQNLWKRRLDFADVGWQTIRFAHGLSSDLAITLQRDTSAQSLWINGMPNASAFGDQATQLSMAVLPYLYASSVRRSVHVGLGSGVTAGAWAKLPGTERTTVVELEGKLWDVTRDFAPFHYGLHENPGVQFVVDDAKSYLDLVPDRSFDVIASEPSQLWSKGVGNLFTTEFYRNVKRKLRPEGLFVTWIMGYEVPGEVWAVAIATLIDEFDHVFAFAPPSLRPDVIFLCSTHPLEFHEDRWARLVGMQGLEAMIPRALRLREVADLVPYAVADRSTLQRLVRDTLERAGWSTIRNTVDLPHLEYMYPRTIVKRGVNVTNDLLGRLLLSRYRPDRDVDDLFLKPPGLEHVSPTFDVLRRMTWEIRRVPMAKLTGFRTVQEAYVQVRKLTPEQRPWVYVTAVGEGNWNVAKGMWPYVRPRLASSFELQEWAVTHAALSRDPDMVRQVLAALPEPSIQTSTRVLRFQLEECLELVPEGLRAARLYVDRFLAGVPPRRFVLQEIHRDLIEHLVEAADKCDAESEVERYLREVDRIFGGRQLYVRLALADLLLRQRRHDEAGQVLARFEGWTLDDPYLRRVRSRYRDARGE